MRHLRAALLLLAVLAAGRPVAAHDTWLSPAARPTSGQPLRFHLTSGAFPAPEHGIEPDRLAAAHVRMGGQVVPLRTQTRRPDVLVLEAPAADSGVAVAWVALKPRPLDLTPALVAEYLREIGEQERIGVRWAQAPEPKRWRETYRKHAKVFVAAGDAARTDESWREPVGLLLEIVPEMNPASLSAGDTVAVRVLMKGAPLAGLPLRAARQGQAGTTQRTDKDGRASFRLDAAGSWLIAGTDLRESAARPGEWESEFTTLSLEVLGPPPSPRPSPSPQPRSHEARVNVDPALLQVDDGDTVAIRWGAAAVEQVRILGIDTPETRHVEHDLPYDQPFGPEARAFAQGAFAAAERIELRRSSTLDPFGRTLGYLWIDGRNYSVMVVTARLAEESVTRYGDNGLPQEAAEVLAAARQAGPLPFESPGTFRGRMRDVARWMKQRGLYPAN